MNNINNLFNQLKKEVSTNVFYSFVFGLILLACVCKIAEKSGGVASQIVNKYNLTHEANNGERLFNNNK